MYLKSIKRGLCAVALALCTTLPAQATLVNTDWKSTGDAKATLDTETGIEWLKLDNTKGYTFAKWFAGDYSTELSGWRLPTVAELNQLVSQYFPGMTTEAQNAYDASRAVAWFNTFGITDPAGARSGSTGYALADNGWQIYQFGQAWNYGSFWNGVYWNNVSSASLYNSISVYAGMFLVSDGGTTLSSINDPMQNVKNPNAPINNSPTTTPAPSDVPAPLFGSIFAMLLVFAGRKKQR